MDFSFVIPTRDRAAQLGACMEALGSMQPVETAWEIVIVDDGSQVPVMAANTSGEAWARSRIVRESGRGPAAARNAGARNARGRILVFIDDDCRAEGALLSALRELYSTRGEVLAGGRIVHGTSANLWSTVTHALTHAAYEIQERRDRRPRRFSTSILAVPREGFIALGGFDESFARPGGEDYEFCERWQDNGDDAVYAPEAGIVHFHPLGFRQFARQQFAYGRGLIRSHAKSTGHEQRRSFATKLLDLSAIITQPFRVAPLARAILLCGGMIVAQFITALGAARESMGGRP